MPEELTESEKKARDEKYREMGEKSSIERLIMYSRYQQYLEDQEELGREIDFTYHMSLAEGERIRRWETKKEIVKNMLQRSKSLEEISDITGLHVSTIQDEIIDGKKLRH